MKEDSDLDLNLDQDKNWQGKEQIYLADGEEEEIEDTG